jgi:hypothetical protein
MQNSNDLLLPKATVKLRAGLAVMSAALMLLACGGGRDDAATPPFAMAKATCGAGDRAETGLAGQVPMAERTAGFQGFNCNLEKASAVEASRGSNVWEQFAAVKDRAGRTCGYVGPANFGGANLGTVVVDLTDPSNAVETAVLNTAAMQGPGEGLRVHAGRGLLISAYYANLTAPAGDVSHGFDVYDVGTDCRHPQLLFTTTALLFPSDSLVAPDPYLAAPEAGSWKPTEAAYGHEGAFAPDGLTYYISDAPHQAYHAVDLVDPTNPRLISTFVNPASYKTKAAWRGGPHGLSISTDGNRGYLTSADYLPGQMVPTTGDWWNGFVIVDTSEIQARAPNAKMHVITEKYARDGSAMQMTIPMRINGKQYLVAEGEAGTGNSDPTGNKEACAAGKTPFGMATIYDIQDEKSPQLVSKLIMETNDPKNCATFSPELDAGLTFIYDVHMCSVDSRENTTTLACGYFQSGIRVYDVRDPARPKEIAYYNPPAKTGQQPGWCGAIPILDAEKGMIYSTCADSGTLALKFTNGVWPFPGTTTPADGQL